MNIIRFDITNKCDARPSWNTKHKFLYFTGWPSSMSCVNNSNQTNLHE